MQAMFLWKLCCHQPGLKEDCDHLLLCPLISYHSEAGSGGWEKSLSPQRRHSLQSLLQVQSRRIMQMEGDRTNKVMENSRKLEINQITYLFSHGRGPCWSSSSGCKGRIKYGTILLGKNPIWKERARCSWESHQTMIQVCPWLKGKRENTGKCSRLLSSVSKV